MCYTMLMKQDNFASIMQQNSMAPKQYNMDMAKALDNRVHMGYGPKKLHPSMSEFIYRSPENKNTDYSVINLDITSRVSNDAFQQIENTLAQGKSILLISAGDAKQFEYVKQFAEKCGIGYTHNQHIPSGMITNWHKVVLEGINRKQQLEYEIATQKGANASQVSRAKKTIATQTEKYQGLIFMANKKPGLIIIINNDPRVEKMIIEAKKANIDVIALCDTNVNAKDVTTVIPCNTSSLDSIAFIMDNLSNAFLNGHAAAVNHNNSDRSRFRSNNN